MLAVWQQKCFVPFRAMQNLSEELQGLNLHWTWLLWLCGNRIGAVIWCEPWGLALAWMVSLQCAGNNSLSGPCRRDFGPTWAGREAEGEMLKLATRGRQKTPNGRFDGSLG